VLRGTAQSPDVFFQAREAANGFYLSLPEIVEKTMDRFAQRSGRRYKLFDYVGDPEAERVIVMMGSGAEVAHETVERLVASGERVGVLKVRVFRPFSIEHFVKALPVSVRRIVVLDRTKEPGAVGEPLYQDAVTALREARDLGTSPLPAEPIVIGGRYGLSSKEFSPAHVKAVFDHLASGKGLCCSMADGEAVADPDWESKDGHYRVHIPNNQGTPTWYDVPDDALITEPNLAGRTMVWPIRFDGTVTIRCFIPGPMT